MNMRIHPISARRNPRNENDSEEQHSDFCVSPCCTVYIVTWAGLRALDRLGHGAGYTSDGLRWLGLSVFANSVDDNLMTHVLQLDLVWLGRCFGGDGHFGGLDVVDGALVGV
jgi:hypothetical protein